MTKRHKIKSEQWAPLVESEIKPTNGPAMHSQGFDEVWKNHLYTVLLRRIKSLLATTDPIIHLSIRRNDRKVGLDWRHKQYIKNQLAGDEVEAIEIFPKESRLVDTSNQYHLWCFPKQFPALPFGFEERLVVDGGKSAIGSEQRPFEKHMRPDDAMTLKEVEDLVSALHTEYDA